MENGPTTIDLHVFRTRGGARAVRITFAGLERPLYFMPANASPYLEDLLRDLGAVIARYRFGQGASEACELARVLGDIDGAVPWEQCPACGVWVPDFDGCGVLFHLADAEQMGCGYCTHPSMTGGVCDFCRSTGPQVHVLFEGRPLCEFAEVPPAEWPEGHRWVPVDWVVDATCPACKRRAARVAAQVQARRGAAV